MSASSTRRRRLPWLTGAALFLLGGVATFLVRDAPTWCLALPIVLYAAGIGTYLHAAGKFPFRR